MNYISKHSVMGMMSQRYISIENYLGFIKNKKEVVLFDSSLAKKYNNYNKINLYYYPNRTYNIEGYNKTSSYSSTMLVSNLSVDFFNLSGKKHREIRETRNKYNKLVDIKYELNDINTVIRFIKQWNIDRGKEKYGWQLHSGYDINFFNRFYNEEKDNLFSNFYYIGDNLVGYAIVSKNKKDNCYNYIIRKNDTKYRNLCLYIDYKIFKRIFIGKDFYINWGCSSGNVLKYKKKFPIYLCEKRYFIKYKKNEQSTIQSDELF